jgi:hypothetical protein
LLPQELTRAVRQNGDRKRTDGGSVAGEEHQRGGVYALTAAALCDASDGAKWKPDPSFNVADTILDDPEFVSVLRVVLRDGHAIVLERKTTK